jgi:hypothetical protein
VPTINGVFSLKDDAVKVAIRKIERDTCIRYEGKGFIDVDLFL